MAMVALANGGLQLFIGNRFASDKLLHHLLVGLPLQLQ